jgi:hypothetical protein
VVCLHLSCGDDDVIEGINESFIDGKWKLIKVTENGTNITLNNCEKMSTIEFTRSNNKVTFTNYDLTENDVCEIVKDSTESYSIDGNTITIDNNTFEVVIRGEQGLELKSTKDSKDIINSYSRQ